MPLTPGLAVAGTRYQPVGSVIGPVHNTKKYAYIDAIRGYAVLLVITCHTGGMFAQLPYPLKKLTNFGWHGVQLFFLMSCVTLLLSWRADESKGRASLAGFWIRRFFRIAPMYYLAAIFYFFAETPKTGFNIVQLLAALGFVNAWHPLLIPTVPDRWMVVPGGWSIGVEFTFYAIFPLMAVLVRSMRAALLFLAGSLVIGCVANSVAAHGLQPEYGPVATRNFIYFWFPNQLPVFALGTILYFALEWLQATPGALLSLILRRAATPVIVLCIAAGVLVANAGFPQSLPFAGPLYVPAFLMASMFFMVFVAVLASNPASMFINQPIQLLGQVSFSAYLLHFAVLHALPRLFPNLFDVHSAGWHAIFICGLLWVCVVPVTFAMSWATFRLVEKPMINVARHLLLPRGPVLTTAAAPAGHL